MGGEESLDWLEEIGITFNIWKLQERRKQTEHLETKCKRGELPKTEYKGGETTLIFGNKI